MGKSKNGQAMHYAVGALINRNNKYLLMDRANPPYGFAGPAGHIDEGESEQQALIRETTEETALKITNYNLIFAEEISGNTCKSGISTHYWYLFACETTGENKQIDKEAKSIGWFSVDQIKQLKLEPVWEYWFKKLNII